VNNHELSKIDFELIGDAIMKRLAQVFAIAAIFAFGAQATSAQTLKAVQDRGQLVCGANGVLAGFGMPDPQGNWTGFDVDYFRAMAAAILPDFVRISGWLKKQWADSWCLPVLPFSRARSAK
jgi:ABC-type amino acid transport substrate-binding protein